MIPGRPLYYLSIAGVINVVLNLFFVIVCNMDVAGVAVASIISQYFSAILVTAALLRSRESYCLRFSQLRFHKTRTKAILSIGIPSGLQNAIFALANLFIQRGVNTFSATMVAGNSAATNADALVYDVMQAFYTACGSFIGQNYGARQEGPYPPDLPDQHGLRLRCLDCFWVWDCCCLDGRS